MTEKDSIKRDKTIEDIVKKYRQMSDEQKADLIASVDAIKTKSLANAPQSFIDFLSQPGNEEFAATFK